MEIEELDSVFKKFRQFLPLSFNCRKVECVQNWSFKIDH